VFSDEGYILDVGVHMDNQNVMRYNPNFSNVYLSYIVQIHT